jgi:hypothetical protein
MLIACRMLLQSAVGRGGWTVLSRQFHGCGRPWFAYLAGSSVSITFKTSCRKISQRRPSRRRTQPQNLTRGFLNKRVIPRFGRKSPLAIEPLEVEKWLREVKKAESLENPTLDKIRRVMNLVYKHGQRYGLIPRDESANPIGCSVVIVAIRRRRRCPGCHRL